ncbi:hypothetical protein [Parasulfitobacter algicola]|uniref:Uncharacterized protein n=1 Tax=Parasulfitobacter algicola TaxID=2614809 RepID=A0ABX2IM85_9RHOB|nr:hypothetical protein [Sulfitobacter algicola]NSX53640.1 hypothetical protein [Sulfitobacter algicola]
MKDEITAANSNVQQIIDDMNAGWRNEVAKALGLDMNTFQIAQGTVGLQSTDSSGLFLMADAVPPKSVAAYYDPSGKNKRSSAYNQMLHAMLPSTSSGLKAALGDQYASWIAYRNADTSDLSQMDLFKKWADRNLDPGKQAAALTAFKAALSDPLNMALDNFIDDMFYTSFVTSAGKSYKLPTYSCEIDRAKEAINTGASAEIDYNSTTASTKSNGTTVSGSASGFYEIFSGSIDGSFEKLNKLATSSAFSIKGQIGKFATIACNAADWYDGAMVSRGYNAKDDNSIWDPNSNVGDWSSFFESDGSLARRVSQLVLVSDYELTVTSHATYSQEDFTQIKTGASFGVWPFFSAKTEATHTETFTHNEDGTLSVVYKLDKGLIQIWGATIQDAPN